MIALEGILRPAAWIAAGLLALHAASVLAGDASRPVLLLHHATNAAVLPPPVRREFDVRLSAGPLTTQSLAGVHILCVIQPARESFSVDEIDVLMNFIDAGGGVLFFTRPPAGEDAPPRPEDKFLHRFGVTVNPPRIGAKTQRLSDPCPLLGGLRWSAGALHTLDLSENSPLTSPVLVMNDLQQKPVRPGAKDFPGAVMIWGRHDKGRLAVVADEAGFLTATADEPGRDNAEVFLRLLHWLRSK